MKGKRGGKGGCKITVVHAECWRAGMETSGARGRFGSLG